MKETELKTSNPVATPNYVYVIGFHHVSDELHDYTFVSEKNFRGIIEGLSGVADFITLEELLCMPPRTTPIPNLRAEVQENPSQNHKPPIVISFDDAYENIYNPIIWANKEFNLKPLIFVITGQIGKTNAWNKKSAYRARHLSLAQIRKLLEIGCEIGSHTVTHRNLLFLNDSEIETEMRDSGKTLLDILKVRPQAVAYPYGFYNEAVLSSANRYYDVGFSTWNKSKSCNMTENRFSLRRVMITSADTFETVVAKLNQLSILESSDER